MSVQLGNIVGLSFDGSGTARTFAQWTNASTDLTNDTTEVLNSSSNGWKGNRTTTKSVGISVDFHVRAQSDGAADESNLAGLLTRWNADDGTVDLLVERPSTGTMDFTIGGDFVIPSVNISVPIADLITCSTSFMNKAEPSLMITAEPS